MSTNSEELVLVTGGSGFLAAHCILALLKDGYKVRTTVRSSAKESLVREMLKVGSAPEASISNVSFAAADLTLDDGWADAVAGCRYVLHVASPFPAGTPQHEDELIVPARDGTLRVLRAAKAAGVRRVVVTSSFGAIGYGHPPQDEPFDETNWTNVDGGGVIPYIKSKAIAEKAAWEFIKSKDGEGMELVVVNPVGIFGPVLGRDFAGSIKIVQQLLEGAVPGTPQISFGVVDVRDVATLHVLAMTHSKAAGERFLAVSPPAMSMNEVALTLRQRVPEIAAKIASITPDIGSRRESTNEKAKTMLGWNPRSREDAIVATAESLDAFGLLKK